jgi:hypothetical protein
VSSALSSLTGSPGTGHSESLTAVTLGQPSPSFTACRMRPTSLFGAPGFLCDGPHAVAGLGKRLVPGGAQAHGRRSWPGTQRCQATWVQHRPAHQGQRRDAFRVPGDKAPQIGEIAAGKMRVGDGQMVQDLGRGRSRRQLNTCDGDCYGRSPLLRVDHRRARPIRPPETISRACSVQRPVWGRSSQQLPPGKHDGRKAIAQGAVRP